MQPAATPSPPPPQMSAYCQFSIQLFEAFLPVQSLYSMHWRQSCGKVAEWVGEALGETLSTSDRSWSLSAICLPHAPKLHVRDKESAAEAPRLLFQALPVLPTFHKGSVKLELLSWRSRISLMKPEPKGSGLAILPCVRWLCGIAWLCCLAKGSCSLPLVCYNW